MLRFVFSSFFFWTYSTIFQSQSSILTSGIITDQWKFITQHIKLWLLFSFLTSTSLDNNLNRTYISVLEVANKSIPPTKEQTRYLSWMRPISARGDIYPWIIIIKPSVIRNAYKNWSISQRKTIAKLQYIQRHSVSRIEGLSFLRNQGSRYPQIEWVEKMLYIKTFYRNLCGIAWFLKSNMNIILIENSLLYYSKPLRRYCIVVIDESSHQHEKLYPRFRTCSPIVLIWYIRFRYIPHSCLRHLDWQKSKESTFTQESQFSNSILVNLWPEHKNPLLATKELSSLLASRFRFTFGNIKKQCLPSESASMEHRQRCASIAGLTAFVPSENLLLATLILSLRFRFTFENINR